MVIETLINPAKAEGRPWETFFLGFLYASIAVFLSLWIFQDYSSLVMVFLTVFASVPLVYMLIAIEEKKDTIDVSEKFLLKEHGKALAVLMFLFLGYTVAFSLWFVVLPESTVTNMFNVQLETIRSINAGVTSFSAGTGFVMQIFSNNIKVMIFSIMFAFLFGAGAIFILTWNASVISAAIGTFIKNNVASYAQTAGLGKLTGYFHIGSLGLLRYMIHGIPEILAYFAAGLAGGIISIAVVRHDFGTKKFNKILYDSIDLIVISILILFIAALIEVFITPILF
ncbi:stage II sporulation protein M [Candidatus Woesearchaeota archaeon]|nr:stage II sporulation protein M [Candidatus Woesearchaeota archaeon]